MDLLMSLLFRLSSSFWISIQFFIFFILFLFCAAVSRTFNWSICLYAVYNSSVRFSCSSVTGIIKFWVIYVIFRFICPWSWSYLLAKSMILLSILLKAVMHFFKVTFLYFFSLYYRFFVYWEILEILTSAGFLCNVINFIACRNIFLGVIFDCYVCSFRCWMHWYFWEDYFNIFPALGCLVSVISVVETKFLVLVFGGGAGRYPEIFRRLNFKGIAKNVSGSSISQRPKRFPMQVFGVLWVPWESPRAKYQKIQLV